ncbi:MAG TPA: hypothetical protein VGI40_28530 [Pirellulaceae bacterium]|jgi:hypothetical protein
MPEIVLSAEQMKILGAAEGLVAIRRPDGSILGWVSPKTNFIIPDRCPFTPEEIAQARVAASEPGPYYTTQEVLAYLRAQGEANS